MMNFERINNDIIFWTGTFDKLVKHFTNTEYGIIMDETVWHNESDGDCYNECYEMGEWADCLKIYLGHWVKDNVDYGVRFGAENIFRLWYETL